MSDRSELSFAGDLVPDSVVLDPDLVPDPVGFVSDPALDLTPHRILYRFG
jgi:hypothetical protein